MLFINRRFSLLLLGILIVMSACQGRGSSGLPTEYPFHTLPMATEPRRVVVVPFYLGDEVGKEAAIMDEAMATALRELGEYEVASIDRKQRDLLFGNPHSKLRNLNTENLRLFRTRYRADALLIGRIDHYDSYDPIAIGVEAHLISCHDGLTLWSAVAHFDSARRDIQEDLEFWYQDVIGTGQNRIGGWQLALQSPRLFARYTSDRLAASIIDDEYRTRTRRRR